MKKIIAILLLLLLVGSELQAQDAAKPKLRTWKDSTGKFSIEAVFVRVDDNRLVLRFPGETFPQNTTWATGKPDELSIPLYLFRMADRQFVLTSTGSLAMPEQRFGSATARRQYYMGEPTARKASE